MTSDTPPIDANSVDEIFSDMEKNVAKVHDTFSEVAANAGEALEYLDQSRQYWKQVINRANELPEITPVVASGVKTLVAYREELRAKVPGLLGQAREANMLITNLGGTILATNSTTSSTVYEYVPPTDFIVTAPTKEVFDEIRAKLMELDPELGDIYSSVRETLYGSISNPERTALFQMRQLFDLFFDQLVQDEEIEKTEIWPKIRDESKQTKKVTRLERIRYAAHTRIVDVFRRNSLLAEAEHMVEVYNRLNTAHARGKLDPEAAREPLREMFILIGKWVNAVAKFP